MELILPILLFAFALYILTAGRRSKPEAPAEWTGTSPGRGRRSTVGELDDLKRTFSQFAEEREGRRLDRAPYEGPRVAYLHRTTRAVLGLHVVAHEDGPDERFTQISYAVPTGWRHRLEIGIATTGELPDLPPPGLVHVVATGDSEFDRRTRILTSDPGVAKSILDAPTRQAITDLRGLLANGHLHWSASGSRILIRKRGVIRGLPELALFARLCDSLYDRLLHEWERENGIEILDGPPEPSEDAPRCQVCSHPMAADAKVRCRRCRTPHHPDCWDFNGGCATFACGEKMFLKEIPT